MKRMSKAEEALQKQVRLLSAQAEDLIIKRNELSVRINSVLEVKNSIETEIGRLASARRAASAKAKP